MSFVRAAVAMTSGAGAGLLLAVYGVAACGEEFSGWGGSGGGAAGQTTTSAGGSGGTTTLVGGSGGLGGGVTSSTASGGSGGAECSDLGEECFACGIAQCRDLYCGCLADSDCTLLAVCVGGAGTQAERHECYAAHPDSISHAALLTNCLGTSCEAYCPEHDALPPCLLCMFESCPTEMNACLASTPCAAVLDCVGDCADPTCVQACLAEPPVEPVGLQEVVDCQAAACMQACPGGGG